MHFLKGLFYALKITKGFELTGQNPFCIIYSSRVHPCNLFLFNLVRMKLYLLIICSHNFYLYMYTHIYIYMILNFKQTKRYICPIDRECCWCRKPCFIIHSILFHIISYHKIISEMVPADLKYDVIVSHSWSLSTLEPRINKFSPWVNKKLCVLTLIITVYYLLPTRSPKISVL